MPSHAPHPRQAGRLALGEILACVGDELADLGRSAHDLQAAIGAIVDHSRATLSLSATIRLQAADSLTQRLAHLAELVRVLEAETPRSWRFEAELESGRNLPAAMARLVRAADHPDQRAPEQEGDCELF